MEREVNVEPSPIPAGEEVMIKYNGLLAQSGADRVYLHFGVDEDWRSSSYLPMEYRDHEGWTANLRIEDADKLNFCFKDSANNWDNNNGHNWTFEVHR